MQQYIGYFNYGATGEGITEYVATFEASSNPRKKFFDKLVKAGNWSANKETYAYFGPHLVIINLATKSAGAPIKKLSWPIPKEIMQHIHAVKQKYNTLTDLEFYRHLNLS